MPTVDRAAYDRQYRIANRERLNSQQRARRRAGGRYKARRRIEKHGINIVEDWALFWMSQEGRCYLCGDGLAEDTAVIDHDHAHCPPRQSCRICRRGLACDRCNRLIGHTGDDPAVLRLIADNLERVIGPTRARITAAAQGGLF